MSKAEELLETLDSANSVMLLSADASSEPHIVIGSDRFITVPDELKRLAVQYDHNVETVTFDCPRYWDEHDMSEWTVYINFRRSDNKAGQYCTTNITVDANNPTIMHFEWTISINVTRAKGMLDFNVCIQDTNEDGAVSHHWNSELCNDCYISEGFELGISDDEDSADAAIPSDTKVYIGANELTYISDLWFDTNDYT